MPDDKQQTDSDEQEQESQDQDQSSDDTRSDDEGEGKKPDKLLGALNKERERAENAERELKKLQRAERTKETERAIKAGEIDTVVKSKDAEIADLRAENEALQKQLTERDTAIVRAKVAAKHRIPALLVDRIRGANEQEMDADAKELAKTVAAPTAPETEAGRGNKGRIETTEEVKAGLNKTGRFRI